MERKGRPRDKSTVEIRINFMIFYNRNSYITCYTYILYIYNLYNLFRFTV